MPKNELFSNPKSKRISYLYDRLSKTSATITELSKELGVSTKTIQRDLHEVLKDAGAVCEGRLWQIDKTKAGERLKGDEGIVLGILDELAKGAGRQFYLKAHNLIEQISSNLNHPIYANIDSEALNSEHLESFTALENAIKNKTAIKCDYRKGSFELKPLKLAFFDGFWYLLAFDIKAKDTFKKFHLKTLKNIELLDIKFEIPSSLEKGLAKANSIWFQPHKQPFTVRLFIEKDAVVYFERKPMKSQSFSARYDNGSAEITVEATDEMEILPIVQWYLPLVQIVEPQWLADEFKTTIQDYLEEISN
ncbi:MAG TPA: WYL domain-containing protein [Campylobacterales bacterium]|nr:WYL domain-containing protein [Campylobacterales bacterium]